MGIGQPRQAGGRAIFNSIQLPGGIDFGLRLSGRAQVITVEVMRGRLVSCPEIIQQWQAVALLTVCSQTGQDVRSQITT